MLRVIAFAIIAGLLIYVIRRVNANRRVDPPPHSGDTEPPPKQLRHQYDDEFVIEATPAKLSIQTYTADVTFSRHFAERWYVDTINEARAAAGVDSIRREIIFATCFAESYLFEWVRDDVLNRDKNELAVYFPPTERRPADQKWKEIPKRLLEDGKISGIPTLEDAFWHDFKDLLAFRNGLIHAAASRPESNVLPGREQPIPSSQDWEKLESGWACRVVAELIRQFLGAAGAQPPSWLEDP